MEKTLAASSPARRPWLRCLYKMVVSIAWPRSSIVERTWEEGHEEIEKANVEVMERAEEKGHKGANLKGKGLHGFDS